MSLNNTENHINTLYSRSYYGTDKKWMSKIKENEFIHPCVYTITQSKGINFYYSNIKKKFFNIPKVIFTNGGGSYSIIDLNGEFGLTSFAYGISDEKENLKLICNALNSKKFIDLMKYCKMDQGHKYNYKVISNFKKDFYLEFQE